MSGRLQLVDLPADRVEGELIATLYYADERPLQGPAALLDWRHNGLLTRRIISGEISGRAGEQLLVQANHKIEGEWALFVGAGSRQGMLHETYLALVRRLVQVGAQTGSRSVALCLAPVEGLGVQALESAISRELSLLPSPVECLLSLERRAPGRGA